MSSRSSQAIVHALKVGFHIFVAVLIVGFVSYVDNNSGQMQAFTSWLVAFGVPAGIVNMVIAGIVKYLKTKIDSGVTIDSLPPQ